MKEESTLFILIFLFAIFAVFSFGSLIGWSAAKFQDVAAIKKQDEYCIQEKTLLKEEIKAADTACSEKISETIRNIKNNRGK